MFDVGSFGVQLATELIHHRLAGHETNGATHGALTKERALRTAQHFDAIDIDDAGIERHGDWRIVQIETCGVVAIDAANCDRARRGEAKRVAVPPCARAGSER